MDNILKATVKSTNETISVYMLRNGNYYDFDNMDQSKPPKAVKANKKEFKPSELIFN